ncbi:protein-domain-containing protein, partial [Endogone sp. FLAS-F59071]
MSFSLICLFSAYQLFGLQRSWMDFYPRVIATSAYTYLRVINDHAKFQQLRRSETTFCIWLLRNKWVACSNIGRDLVRALHDVSNITEFRDLWMDILYRPRTLSPQFEGKSKWHLVSTSSIAVIFSKLMYHCSFASIVYMNIGVSALLNMPTPKEYLQSRLTLLMEHKLLYILTKLKIGGHQKNLLWFQERYIFTPESGPLTCDIIRFMIAGWWPDNTLLASEIVPRYVVIGAMIRAVKDPVIASNVKLALIYDWLFFKEGDNIMWIEPAMLLMERSVERYPYITTILMEYLKFTIDEYHPPIRDYIAQCIAFGMKELIRVGVIRNLIYIYNNPNIDGEIRGYMHEIFRESFPSTGATPDFATSPADSTGLIDDRPSKPNGVPDDVDEFADPSLDENGERRMSWQPLQSVDLDFGEVQEEVVEDGIVEDGVWDGSVVTYENENGYLIGDE